MEKTTVRFRVSGQELTMVGNYHRFASNSVGLVRIEVEPSDEWLSFDSVDCIFQNDQDRTTMTMFYEFSAYACMVPASMLSRISKVLINLSGKNMVDGDLVERLTTYPTLAFVVDVSSNVANYRETVIPANQYEQFVELVGRQANKLADVEVSAHESDVPEVLKTFSPDAPMSLDFGLVRGAAAGFGTATASIDDNVGTPSVEVTTSGPDTAKVFDFAFSNMKGNTGEKGDTGDAAGFGTVSATVDANHGTPAVTVTTSGDDTAKNFAFDFKNLQPAPYDDSVIQARMDTFTNLAQGSTTGDAELADGRVGADGVTYTNIGGAIRGQVSDLKSDLSETREAISIFSKLQKTRGELVYSGWRLKEDGTRTGNANFSIYAVLCGLAGEDIDDIFAYIPKQEGATAYYQFQNTKYVNTDTSAVIGSVGTQPIYGSLSVPSVISGGVYFVYNVRNTDTDAGVYTSKIENDLEEQSALLDTTKAKANKIIDFPVLRNGSAGNTGNASSVCPASIMPTNGADKITILISKPFKSGAALRRFQLTTYSVSSGQPESSTSSRILIDVNFDTISNGFTLTKEMYGDAVGFACALYERNAENTSSIAIRITDFNEGDYSVIYDFDYSANNSDSYLVDSGLMRRSIQSIYQGKASGVQSFLRYNNKYYSTDGSTLYVQNNDFTAIDSVSLNLGHGNSFQLGDDGYGYVSGWNDNNLYKIDLENLTIADTIALPTTGNTTCAVDTVNGIAYIFQRESSSTVDRYNFIKYDYVNQSIISTKQIFAYGAMQACDFYHDRILMVYGTANNPLPNGYKVLNKNGDILVDYYFPVFSANEPEGVCIDRDTHEMYIGFWDSNGQKIYKILSE